MKKIGILLCVIILLCGCNQKKETIIATCKKDEFQPTYTASFTFTIKSVDNESISSIDIASIYNATYEDTNMNLILDKIQKEVTSYQNNFKDVTIDTGEEKGQAFSNITVPMNKENILLFQNSDASLVKDGKLLINSYRSFLSSQGYTCS